MLNSAFKVLSEIQRKSRKRRRVVEFIPTTCKACEYERAYPDGQKVCENCGTVGELIRWERVK